MKSPYTCLVETDSTIILSVVTVAAYDNDRLKVSLESFRGASHRIEFIVVCPKDDVLTMDLVFSLRLKFGLRINVVNDCGTGVYQAMNVGAESARGINLTFWNAGDFCTSIKLLNDFVAELQNSSAEWGIFDAEFSWRSKQVLDQDNLNKFVLQRGGYISHQSIFVKKSTFTQLGCFDSTFKVAADTLLITKLWKKCEVEFFNSIIVNVEFPQFSAKFNRFGRYENLKIWFLEIPVRFKLVTLGFTLRRELVYAFRRIIKQFRGSEGK